MKEKSCSESPAIPIHAALRAGLAVAIALVSLWLAHAQEPASSTESMLQSLRKRVEEDPGHSDSWRLIGRLYERSGNKTEALSAYQSALQADPESVAAHFDLGRLLASMGRDEEAFEHYQDVHRFGPGSRYAEELNAEGHPAAASNPDQEAESLVKAAGYRVQTFDGSEAFERTDEKVRVDNLAYPTRRFHLLVDAGLLYNSNVSQTPISRELIDADASSFQALLNPEIEWRLMNNPWFRSGPLARGYFSVNESHQDAFDLASFQGGWFFERESGSGQQTHIDRLDYVFSIDDQGGRRFGERHELTLSRTTVSALGDIVYLYGAINHSDFADDGDDPSIDSLDGPGLLLGAMRSWKTPWETFDSVRMGCDLSAADTVGSDYRFFGGSISGGLVAAIGQSITFEPDFGIGFRAYDDFTGAVSRDETVIRGGLKLRRRFSDHLSVALIAGYDRFASDNEEFDASRTEGGVVSTWTY